MKAAGISSPCCTVSALQVSQYYRCGCIAAAWTCMAAQLQLMSSSNQNTNYQFLPSIQSHLLTLWKHLCIVGLNRTLKPVWFPGYQTHFCMYRVTEPPTLFHISDYKVTCTSDGLPPCDGDCQIKPSAAGKIRHSGIRENTVVITHTIY